MLTCWLPEGITGIIQSNYATLENEKTSNARKGMTQSQTTGQPTSTYECSHTIVFTSFRLQY